MQVTNKCNDSMQQSSYDGAYPRPRRPCFTPWLYSTIVHSGLLIQPPPPPKKKKTHLGMLGGQSTRPQNYGTLLLLKIVHACKMGANNVHPQSRQVSWHGACPVCLAGVLLTRIGEHRRSSWQENSPGSQELG